MVIGIRGSSGVGKSTFATMLSYYLNNVGGNANLFDFMAYKREADNGHFQGKWKVANFASTLKIAMATMYGIDYKQYEDGEFKDTKIGQDLFKVTYTFGSGGTFGNGPKFTLATFDSKEKAEDFAREMRRAKSGSTGINVEVFSPTWRDTLNQGGEGLHQYLGPNIALQAYQHRFSNSIEHHIMADVRKPREIDLIYENGGIIIELKRNFVFMCSYKEAMKFLREKGYAYNLADGNNPEKITDDFVLQELEDYKIPVGIDCTPKPNIADRWLDGDNRADFIFHNPAGNPKNDSSYVQLFEEIGRHYNTILTTLITR